MRIKMKMVLALVLVIALVLPAGCADVEDPTVEELAATVFVYFYDAEEDTLVPVEREVELVADTVENRLQAAMEELIKGPGPDEETLYSSIMENTELLSLEYNRPYATLNFNSDFEQMGGTAWVSTALDQVLYTATDLAEVSAIYLSVEGEQVGTADRPFTGEGFLFEQLYRPAAGDWAQDASPAECLESFMVTIGADEEDMWSWMGPRARELWGSPDNIEVSALAEGLGSWRDYEVREEVIENDTAWVTIQGEQVLEGMTEPDAEYTAEMVLEEGVWKWNLAKE